MSGVISVGSDGCRLGGVDLTVMLSAAVLPLPPPVEVTAPVVFPCFSVAVAPTFTAKLQEKLGESMAPDRLTLPGPAVAVFVSQPQVPEGPLGVVITRPAGGAAEKPIPVREALALGLERSKAGEEVPFIATLEAPKDFEIVGGRVVGGGDDPPGPPPHA